MVLAYLYPDAQLGDSFPAFARALQKRDRLRLVLDYRKKHLDLLLRGGEEDWNSSTPHPTLSPMKVEGGEKRTRPRRITREAERNRTGIT